MLAASRFKALTGEGVQKQGVGSLNLFITGGFFAPAGGKSQNNPSWVLWIF